MNYNGFLRIRKPREAAQNACGATVDVIAGLIALGLGLICARSGARRAYLNAELA